MRIKIIATTIAFMASSCSKENDLLLFKSGVKVNKTNESPAIEIIPILSQSDYDGFGLTLEDEQYLYSAQSPADMIEKFADSICNTCTERTESGDSGSSGEESGASGEETKVDPCDPYESMKVEAKGNVFMYRLSWKADPKDKCEYQTTIDYFYWTMCPGVNFDVLNGKEISTLSEEVLKPFYEVMSACEFKTYSESKSTRPAYEYGYINGKQTKVQKGDMTTIYATSSGFGEPCTRTAAEGGGFINGCKEYRIMKKNDKIDVEILDKTELIEKEPGSYWFDGGKLSIRHNRWVGEFTYVNGQTPPSYVISKDGTETTGTLKVEDKEKHAAFSLTAPQKKAAPKSPLEVLFPHRRLSKSRPGGI